MAVAVGGDGTVAAVATVPAIAVPIEQTDPAVGIDNERNRRTGRQRRPGHARGPIGTPQPLMWAFRVPSFPGEARRAAPHPYVAVPRSYAVAPWASGWGV